MLAYSLVNVAASFINYLPLFVVVYGIGSGLCLGLGYLLSLYVAWTYLPTQKTLVTGLCLFATGMCPTLLTMVVSAIAGGEEEHGEAHHENEKPEDNFKKLFLTLGAIYFSIFVTGLLILPPPQKSQTMKIQERENERKKSSVSSLNAERSEADLDDFMNDSDHPLNRYSQTSSRPSASGEISISNTL